VLRALYRSNFESLIIWKRCLEFPFEVLSLLLPIPRTCLPDAAVYPLWTFPVPQPSVLVIGSYLCLLLPSFPWSLQKSYQRHFVFFLLRLGASHGLSGYFQQDCLGTFPEIFWGYFILCSVQCRKPVYNFCCKLYCFLFLEFLEIQRRNVLSFVF